MIWSNVFLCVQTLETITKLKNQQISAAESKEMKKRPYNSQAHYSGLGFC